MMVLTRVPSVRSGPVGQAGPARSAGVSSTVSRTMTPARARTERARPRMKRSSVRVDGDGQDAAAQGLAPDGVHAGRVTLRVKVGQNVQQVGVTLGAQVRGEDAGIHFLVLVEQGVHTEIIPSARPVPGGPPGADGQLERLAVGEVQVKQFVLGDRRLADREADVLPVRRPVQGRDVPPAEEGPAPLDRVGAVASSHGGCGGMADALFARVVFGQGVLPPSQSAETPVTGRDRLAVPRR